MASSVVLPFAHRTSEPPPPSPFAPAVRSNRVPRGHLRAASMMVLAKTASPHRAARNKQTNGRPGPSHAARPLKRSNWRAREARVFERTRTEQRTLGASQRTRGGMNDGLAAVTLGNHRAARSTTAPGGRGCGRACTEGELVRITWREPGQRACPRVEWSRGGEPVCLARCVRAPLLARSQRRERGGRR